MKKVFALYLSIMLIVLPCFSAWAATDDMIFTTAIVSERTRSTVTGHKSYSPTDGSGSTIATATLTGSFTFNGTTSSCTGASCDVTIYNNSWSTKSVNAYTSGYSAIAEVTIIRKLLFITVETKSFSITLSCDRYGNLT